LTDLGGHSSKKWFAGQRPPPGTFGAPKRPDVNGANWHKLFPKEFGQHGLVLGGQAEGRTFTSLLISWPRAKKI